MSNWISVDERLPKVEKTYLVKTGTATFCSKYKDKEYEIKVRYGGRNRIADDIAFSTIKLNYKKPWSIERGPGEWAKHGGKVIAWAYLPGEGEEDDE